MDPLKYLEIASLIIHSMEYLKDGTANGNLDDLLYRMLLGKKYGTVLIPSVIVVDGEVHL